MATDRPVIREVITKAVCGTGTYKYQRSIDLEVPVSHDTVQVLGNFVSNAVLTEAKVVDSTKYGKAVQVKGHYDVHVWYAYDQETRAAKSTVTFIEYIPIKMHGGESISNPQAFANIVQKPRCRKAYVKKLGDKSVIRVEIEQDLSAEVVGTTKLKVGIIPSALASSEPVMGQELLAPQGPAPIIVNHEHDYSFDLKYEEDLPEEDDEEEDYFQNEYND